MSIRPVDLQVLVQRSGEVNRAADNNPRQDGNAQVFAEVMKKEVRQEEQQVRNLHKSEHEKVNKDGKGNSGNGGQEKEDEKKDGKNKEPMKEAPRHMGMFDVSV